MLCFPPPVVGVMSTGDELVDASAAPSGTKVRLYEMLIKYLLRNNDVICGGIDSPGLHYYA